ncbi:MAG: hypothetical protein WD749_10830 [Phycisphaerales bacterium]
MPRPQAPLAALSPLALLAALAGSAAPALAQTCQWDLSAPGPTSSSVMQLMVYNGLLHMCGNFSSPVNRIGTWTGSSWADVGGGLANQANDFVIWNDGGGPALFVVGPFTTAGGGTVAAARVAKWNGSTWSALGAGVGSTPSSVEVWDDGTGPALYVGGSFTTPGLRLVKWTGTSWVQVGPGFGTGTVNAMTVFQNQLHIFGTFTTLGDNTPVARGAVRWDGTSFSNLTPSGLGPLSPSPATSGCMVWNDGLTGESVFVWGSFDTAGSVTVNGLARWDGTAWHSVGGGATQASGAGAWIRSATIFDDGTGPAMWIGSSAPTSSGFTHVGGIPAAGIAKWNGTAWSAPNSAAIDNNVFSLRQFDDGTGNRVLWVGGQFVTIGGQPVNRIARWTCQPPPPPACYANCDDSTTAPVLNVADFGCFLTRYAAGEPYANCDESTTAPVLNVADFGCFLTRYAAGCP